MSILAITALILTGCFNHTSNDTNVIYKKATWSIDSDADGTADRIVTYTYDASGNLLIESKDSDADGTADAITTYTWISFF